jgi:hypothetical protein
MQRAIQLSGIPTRGFAIMYIRYSIRAREIRRKPPQRTRSLDDDRRDRARKELGFLCAVIPSHVPSGRVFFRIHADYRGRKVLIRRALSFGIRTRCLSTLVLMNIFFKQTSRARCGRDRDRRRMKGGFFRFENSKLNWAKKICMRAHFALFDLIRLVFS